MIKIRARLIQIIFISLLTFFMSCGSRSDDNIPHSNKQTATIKFNKDWFFKLDDNTTYAKKLIADNSWKKLNLPHDWSIEGTYDTIYGTDWQSGYLPAGIGWYQKEFYTNINTLKNNIKLQFDGVYMNSTVYINGKKVGEQHYGYTSFLVDMTPFLKKGKNLIAVRVDHSKPKSARWYTGSGIYRNVWLKIEPKIHFKTWEQFVTADFNTNGSVDVIASGILSNNSESNLKGKIIYSIKNPEGSVIDLQEQNTDINASENINFKTSFTLKNPALWSLETPNQHILFYKLLDDKNNLIDSDSVSFGIRKLEFSAKWGFKLNDKNIKIKGVCLHHDAGAYGAAVPENILLYRLNLLKEMGANAIRTSHNPFSPEFYTMCDSLGILVLNEIFDGWENAKAEDDYSNYFEENWQHDVSNWVKRDRNHPSVFMYSIGNEVNKPTQKTQKMLIDFIKNIDDTRPITQGGHDPTRGMEDELGKTLLDVKGFNGDGEEIGRFEAYHKQFPTTPIIGTEVPHTYQTRGVYRTTTQWRRKDFPAKWEIDGGSAGIMKGLEGKCYPIADLATSEVFSEELTTHYKRYDSLIPIPNIATWSKNLYYQSSYDNATVRTSARKAWQRVEELDFLMGEFRWTGFDYLGETNQWPSRFANFGIIDIANIPKDHFYLYQSLWSSKPMVHLLPHWTHIGKEGTNIPVVVYTNTDEVELFLNNRSLGKQTYQGEQLVWQVPYEAGNIVAKAYKNNTIVAEKSYATATGKPKITLTTNTNELNSKNYENTIIFINITDENGNIFPYADNYVSVTVDGPAKLKGLDNGDPIDLTPYFSNKRRAFRGRLVAFVEATGKGNITITASLESGITKSIQLNSK